LKRINFAQYKYPEYRFQGINSSNLPASDGAVDYILIISVLHHIPDSEIHEYFKEFKRILKPSGKIILMEPYVCNKIDLRSKLMCFLDRGKYIRSPEEYLNLFEQHHFRAHIKGKYNQMVIYKKIIVEANQSQQECHI